MSKLSGYVKTFKVRDGDNDKNNKLMSFHINDEKLLENYKAIGAKIEELKHIKLSALPLYGRLSWWKSFWRLDIINALLIYSWYERRNWFC